MAMISIQYATVPWEIKIKRYVSQLVLQICSEHNLGYARYSACELLSPDLTKCTRMETEYSKCKTLCYLFREAGLLVVSLAALLQESWELAHHGLQLVTCSLGFVFHQLSKGTAFGQKVRTARERLLPRGNTRRQAWRGHSLKSQILEPSDFGFEDQAGRCEP